MAAVAVSKQADPASQANHLRAELKKWERAFAAANDGRKAGREDIKKNPEIAAKYKAYSRVKSLKTKSKEDGSFLYLEGPQSKKRRHKSPDGPGSALLTTPRKAAKETFATPSTSHRFGGHLPSRIDPYDSPSTLHRVFSPSTHIHRISGSSSPQLLKHAIGPTPQRDGKALGLFDLLSESGGSKATPSAKRLADLRDSVSQTPSNRNRMAAIAEEGEDDDDNGNLPRGRRTPASSGKKYLLASLFETPTSLRYAAMIEAEDRTTFPRAIGGNNLSGNAETAAAAQQPSEANTPVFLRRSNSGQYPTNGTTEDGLSPIAVRKPRAFVGKGLSDLIKGLRDMEESQTQDDWDALREVEEATEAQQQAGDTEVQVNDSQATGDQDGRPWKKKGQKRTTRRVVLRPIVYKSKPEPQAQPHADAEDESEDELAAVSTAQSATRTVPMAEDREIDAASIHSLSDPELELGSEEDYAGEELKAAKSNGISERIPKVISAVVKRKQMDKERKATQPQAKKEDEIKKPRKRKVNPAAHANYRSLKIRNKNSKGRFARRYGRK